MKRRTGFTLIELLVVIAIIALLAAILFPVFARARENARRASCQSNLKQLALGIIQYAQDYDEKMPLPTRAATGGESPKAWYGATGSFTQYTWVDAIDPYVKSGQIFRCPSDHIHRSETTGTYGQISYGMSGFMNGVNTRSWGPRIEDATKTATGQALAAIVSVSHKLLLGDIYKGSGNAGPVLIPNVGTYAAESRVFPLDMEVDDSTAWGVNILNRKWDHSGRHFGGANVAFVDGHVKFMKSTEPGLMFADSGTCSTGSGGQHCFVDHGYGTDEFISWWNPGADKPY